MKNGHFDKKTPQIVHPKRVEDQLTLSKTNASCSLCISYALSFLEEK
jgi:hypothetical protein